MRTDQDARNAATETKHEARELPPSEGQPLNVRRYLPPGFPTITVLCGSTRFGDAFRDALRLETLANHVVLSVGLLGHAEGIDMNGPVKAMLDDLHKRKIDLSDEILVLNVGRYLGSSTIGEIEYAIAHGKAIRFLEPVSDVRAEIEAAKRKLSDVRDAQKVSAPGAHHSEMEGRN